VESNGKLPHKTDCLKKLVQRRKREWRTLLYFTLLYFNICGHRIIPSSTINGLYFSIVFLRSEDDKKTRMSHRKRQTLFNYLNGINDLGKALKKTHAI